MEGLGLISAVIVGGLAGWIAAIIMKAETGLLTNIILGIVGAVIGNMLLSAADLSAQPGSWLGQGIAGLIGAIVLIWGYRAIRGRR